MDETTGHLTISDSVVSGNFGADGGGFSLEGELTISASTISNNFSAANGGGISARGFDYQVIVEDTTISGNVTANGSGGGISNSSLLTITGSTVSGNSVQGSFAHGGGILNSRNVLGEMSFITNSTISGNSVAEGLGGGIYSNIGTLVIEHSTITANTAPAGNGSGIAARGRLTNTRVDVAHTIIADNTNEDVMVTEDFFGGVTTNTIGSLGFNLVGTGIGFGEGSENSLDPFTADASSLTGIAPGLAALADNGGLTETHALQSGSPAINRGDPNFVVPPDSDQRGTGFDRVADGRIDIGALELQSATTSPSADFDRDGDIDGRDFLLWQRGFGKPDAIKEDGDADDDKDVDAVDLGFWETQFGEPAPQSNGPAIAVSAPAVGDLVDLAMALDLLDTPFVKSKEALVVDDLPVSDLVVIAVSPEDRWREVAREAASSGGGSRLLVDEAVDGETVVEVALEQFLAPLVE